MTASHTSDCGAIFPLLDRWLDRELSPAETSAVQIHLGDCPSCSAIVARRTALRHRLRGVAAAVEAPPDLAVKIRRQLYQPAPSFFSRNWLLAPVAAALLLVLAIGLSTSYQRGGLRFTEESQEFYISSISPQTVPVMRVGLQQHVHCAVFRKASAFPSPAQMAEWLGPSFQKIIPVVESHLPRGFHVVDAHRCTYHDRQYVHLAATDGKRLLSLLITDREQGEAFESDLRAVAAQSGVRLYSSGVQRFSLAGFETPGHLVYLVSDLDNSDNLAALKVLTPEIDSALRRIENT